MKKLSLLNLGLLCIFILNVLHVEAEPTIIPISSTFRDKIDIPKMHSVDKIDENSAKNFWNRFRKEFASLSSTLPVKSIEKDIKFPQKLKSNYVGYMQFWVNYNDSRKLIKESSKKKGTPFLQTGGYRTSLIFKEEFGTSVEEMKFSNLEDQETRFEVESATNNYEKIKKNGNIIKTKLRNLKNNANKESESFRKRKYFGLFGLFASGIFAALNSFGCFEKWLPQLNSYWAFVPGVLFTSLIQHSNKKYAQSKREEKNYEAMGSNMFHGLKALEKHKQYLEGAKFKHDEIIAEKEQFETI